MVRTYTQANYQENKGKKVISTSKNIYTRKLPRVTFDIIFG